MQLSKAWDILPKHRGRPRTGADAEGMRGPGGRAPPLSPSAYQVGSPLLYKSPQRGWAPSRSGSVLGLEGQTVFVEILGASSLSVVTDVISGPAKRY